MLHIGPQKTGTTALQVALHQTRAELREHGVAYPGKGTRPRKASWSLLGMPDGSPAPPLKHWHAFCREVEAAGDARVCISTEDWARTDLDGASAVVDGVGGGRPHVVATARRLDKLFPSQWQQRVKMRRISYSYEEWLEIVLGDDREHPVWRNIWVPHDIQAVAERWSKVAGGPENFTLVVADESDRALLPRTFEQMLGLPEGMLSRAATDERNKSMSFSRIDAIRRLNRVFEEHPRLGDPDVEDLHFRLTNVLRDEAPWEDEQRIPALPAWAAQRVAELSQERARTVRSLGVRVVGDPDHLLAPSTPTVSRSPAPSVVSTELAVRVVEDAIAALEEQHAAAMAQREDQLRKARDRARRARRAQLVDETSARDLLGIIARRGARRLRR